MNKLFIAIFFGLIFFGLAKLYFDDTQSRLIGLVALMVILWSNEGLELGTVSLLPLLLFPIFGVVDFNAVAPNYAKPIIFLFIGGFLLAIGMQKSGLHKVVAHKILTFFPKNALGVIYALSLTSALLSTLLSNITTTILLLPMALFLTDDKALKIRFVLAVAYGATIGGILTPIGTAPNMLLLQFLQDQGLERIVFFQWVVKLLPLVALMLIFMPWFLARGVKDKLIKMPQKQVTALSIQQKKVAWILSGLALLLFFNAPIEPFYAGLGLNEKMLLLGAGLLLFSPKINLLEWEDTKQMPYSIIFLFGASFTIASAFTTTGLGSAIAQPVSSLALLPWALLIFSVALTVSFSTEITSNTALISIALPIFYGLSQLLSVDTLVLMMVATVASSYAFMLPIATPPNAIAMSTGIVTVKQMVFLGLVLNLLGIFLLTIISWLFW